MAEIAALPPLEAIAALAERGKRLDPSFSWQDAWQADHAAMFTVAKSAGFDILAEIYDALLEALSEGRTFRDFARDLTPVLQGKGWWGRQPAYDPQSGEMRWSQLGSVRRLQTIFGANMRVSYAAGHWSRFERTKAARPYLRYVCILDEATRPAHRARHNLVLPVDHPYWDKWAPPCGWGCRCTLQSLSEREVKRLQDQGEALFFEPPPDTFRNFVNRRTGEISRVPDGIDPGWAYNPGKAGHQAVVRSAFAERVAAGHYELSRAAIDELLASEDFRRFMERPDGAMPVMALPPELTAALGTETSGVILSDETMRKQLRQHPELTIDDYRMLSSLPETATLVIQDGPLTIVLIREDGDRWRHAAIKTTGTRKAAFLTSYRLSNLGNVERMLSRGKVIVDRR